VPAPGGADVPTPAFETDQIVELESYSASIGGLDFTVGLYRNDDYRCGREGTFPFVVLEPRGAVGEDRPLWVMLHGGGIGYYDAAGRYESTTTEARNDAETVGELLRLPLRYLGADGANDTFVGDRIRAGDRLVLGSLCDHDLYLGLGQPYPNNPHHADTVDGLLANLAMIEAVTDATDAVTQRPTSSLWVLGTSAGSFGAYALAHNLWARGVEVAGVILDSGVLVQRLLETPAGSMFGEQGFVTKHGPYVAEESQWIDRAVAAGFDVPLFDTVQRGDRTCAGQVEPVAEAARFDSNCAWVHDGLADAIAEGGDPDLQQVHVYPGRIHTATDQPATEVQDDLRSWYDAVTTAQTDPTS
jgi:hypothetical protein